MDVDGLRQQLDAIKVTDAERVNFLETLIGRIELITAERDEAITKLAHADKFSKYLQTEIKHLETKSRNMEMEMERDPFVLVLIDGDNTKFTDDYIRRGALGGHDAARELRKRIESYMETLEGFQPHWKILVQVFANFSGLSKCYHDKSTFWQFILGFNKEYDLCGYIDAGNDKEAADVNIKGAMGLFYRNVHCKHILLAGSRDGGYTTYLRQYTLTNEVCKRLTLIEALPFAASLKDLSPKFFTTKFEGLFRDCDIQLRKDLPKDHNRPVTPPETPRISYASTVSKGKSKGIELGPLIDFDSSSRLPPSPPPSTSSSNRQQNSHIPRNRHGCRIDPPVHADQKLVYQLKSKKLCNRYFLSSCPYEDCTHNHNAKLTDPELEALKQVARLSPCPRGAWCEDPTCVAGHRCVQDPVCTRGSNCRFAEEMHNVDMKVAEFVTV